MKVYLNSNNTAVPPNDIHREFIDYVAGKLSNAREQRLFQRMYTKVNFEGYG